MLPSSQTQRDPERKLHSVAEYSRTFCVWVFCVCAFFFFFLLLNKWMCLGVAWEAEAPPTHLEALNSLKGPGVRRLERKASQHPLWESLLWPLLGLYLAPLALAAVGYLRKVDGGEASLPASLSPYPQPDSPFPGHRVSPGPPPPGKEHSAVPPVPVSLTQATQHPPLSTCYMLCCEVIMKGDWRSGGHSNHSYWTQVWPVISAR